MSDTGIELLHLGHLNLDGTPGEADPEGAVIYAQVDVTLTDKCHVTPRNIVAT